MVSQRELETINLNERCDRDRVDERANRRGDGEGGKKSLYRTLANKMSEGATWGWFRVDERSKISVH